MKNIPTCPSILPFALEEPLRQFANSWVNSEYRPKPASDILNHWDQLIREWAECKDLPLFIRKPTLGRGQYLKHVSGRDFVPVDNSPPHWSLIQALKGQKPTLFEIREAIDKDLIPVAMILKKTEKESARLTHTRTQGENLNHHGWKLAHIEPVGLNTRIDLKDVPLSTLKEHFIKLMSPSNMFLIPLSLAGLAETEIMIEAIRKANIQLAKER